MEGLDTTTTAIKIIIMFACHVLIGVGHFVMPDEMLPGTWHRNTNTQSSVEGYVPIVVGLVGYTNNPHAVSSNTDSPGHALDSCVSAIQLPCCRVVPSTRGPRVALQIHASDHNMGSGYPRPRQLTFRLLREMARIAYYEMLYCAVAASGQ
jgi:hypothetical protein